MAVNVELGFLRGTVPGVLTAFGVVALSFMMVMYALEQHGRVYLIGFAAGCALSSTYGFLAGTWPFGTVEALWTGVALRRWAGSRPGPQPTAG